MHPLISFTLESTHLLTRRIARIRAVPGLPASLAVVPLALGGWALLLPVVPLEMTRNGASTAAASLSTAVFMTATVLTQFVTPPLLRAAGYRVVIIAGAGLMAVPCLALLVSTAPWWWYAMSAVRGIGFGILTVTCTSLPAKISPPDLLQRTAAAQGLAMSFTQAAGVGSGLLLDSWFAFEGAAIAGFALPVLGCVVLTRVPSMAEASRSRRRRSSSSRIRRERSAVIVLLVTTSAVFGGLSALVPIGSAGSATSSIVALTLISTGVMAGRFAAGRYAGLSAFGRLDTGAVILAGATMTAFAVPGWLTSQAVVIYVSAAIFGICWGVIQNDTLVALFRLYADQGHAEASKWWNVGVDAGVGLGSFGFGATASAMGLSTAFGAAAVVLLLSAPLGIGLMVAERSKESTIP